MNAATLLPFAATFVGGALISPWIFGVGDKNPSHAIYGVVLITLACLSV